MYLYVDESRFPFVRMVVAPEGKAPPGHSWTRVASDAKEFSDAIYFDAMRRLARRGKFGVVFDLRQYDVTDMPPAPVRQRIYENAKTFYQEHAATVLAVAMVYHSKTLEMLATLVGWARTETPKDSRRTFGDMNAADEWVREKLRASGVAVRAS